MEWTDNMYTLISNPPLDASLSCSVDDIDLFDGSEYDLDDVMDPVNLDDLMYSDLIGVEGEEGEEDE